MSPIVCNYFVVKFLLPSIVRMRAHIIWSLVAYGSMHYQYNSLNEGDTPPFGTQYSGGI